MVNLIRIGNSIHSEKYTPRLSAIINGRQSPLYLKSSFGNTTQIMRAFIMTLTHWGDVGEQPFSKPPSHQR
jgi:hypothetical protein